MAQMPLFSPHSLSLLHHSSFPVILSGNIISHLLSNWLSLPHCLSISPSFFLSDGIGWSVCVWEYARSALWKMWRIKALKNRQISNKGHMHKLVSRAISRLIDRKCYRQLYIDCFSQLFKKTNVVFSSFSFSNMTIYMIVNWIQFGFDS